MRNDRAIGNVVSNSISKRTCSGVAGLRELRVLLSLSSLGAP